MATISTGTVLALQALLSRYGNLFLKEGKQHEEACRNLDHACAYAVSLRADSQQAPLDPPPETKAGLADLASVLAKWDMQDDTTEYMELLTEFEKCVHYAAEDHGSRSYSDSEMTAQAPLRRFSRSAYLWNGGRPGSCIPSITKGVTDVQGITHYSFRFIRNRLQSYST